ncbi:MULTISPECIES: L-rhamnose mutarotase [Proteiniphilum]|jgi:L-rhamnose mutarotase|uniref:L-rhamnose mutarotase n=1 Tax=Proteiniphilum TaxID=294702 RepID=UPI001EEA4CF2|nr:MULTISPECIES: L-rhamnose mutarotase [Proteiniphilum]ULB33401.1 L-rhamnose mutarotase [Proteiniphilum propionicum]
MKRYCQTLDLKDDPILIAAYVEEHENVWGEILEGIREVGILDMQIYLLGNRLFMIVDTVDDFDWEKDNARLASLPRQKEWEEHMSKYQASQPEQPSYKKWRLMEQIFGLND